MAVVRRTLDATRPPKLTGEARSRLDALTDTDITASATSDPDNPPLTDSELERLASVRLIKETRLKTGLSQEAFAERFHVNLGRLRDLEQGRTTADSALSAYFHVIALDQKAVERALSAA